jgi:hypothetical protein
MAHGFLPAVPLLAARRLDPAAQCTYVLIHPGVERKCVDDDINEEDVMM